LTCLMMLDGEPSSRPRDGHVTDAHAEVVVIDEEEVVEVPADFACGLEHGAHGEFVVAGELRRPVGQHAQLDLAPDRQLVPHTPVVSDEPALPELAIRDVDSDAEHLDDVVVTVEDRAVAECHPHDGTILVPALQLRVDVAVGIRLQLLADGNPLGQPVGVVGDDRVDAPPTDHLVDRVSEGPQSEVVHVVDHSVEGPPVDDGVCALHLLDREFELRRPLTNEQLELSSRGTRSAPGAPGHEPPTVERREPPRRAVAQYLWFGAPVSPRNLGIRWA
jgi:hypothetical protein